MYKALAIFLVTLPLAVAQEPAPPGKLVDFGDHRGAIHWGPGVALLRQPIPG